MKSFAKAFLLILFFSACSSGISDSGRTSVSASLVDRGIPVFDRTGGTTYYLSADGDDRNDGLSLSALWKSLDKLNDELYSFGAGDTILFRCGDSFPGFLKPSRGRADNWVRYASYGSGAKPVISGALDLSSSRDWEYNGGSVWRSTNEIPYDVGGVFYNGTESAGARKWSVNELSTPGDFYYEPATAAETPPGRSCHTGPKMVRSFRRTPFSEGSGPRIRRDRKPPYHHR